MPASKHAAMTSQSRLVALRSPIFVVALVVLVVNDHWLKGAGLFPGWVTGKLSDFAGLIVAPVLVATVLGASTLPARLLCWVAVVVPFSAIKLWPPAARALEQLMGSVGLPGRIWSDPTDLVTLSVLPLAWWVHANPSPKRTPRGARWLERGTAIAAAMACLATSSSTLELTTAIAVLNTTHDTIKLQVFRPREPLDCASVVADPESTLTADDFEFEGCHTLQALEMVPLDLDWRTNERENDLGFPPSVFWRECDAVLLRAPGLDDTILFWNDVPQDVINQSGGIPANDAHVAYIEQVGKQLFIARPDISKAWLPNFSLPAASCEAASP